MIELTQDQREQTMRAVLSCLAQTNWQISPPAVAQFMYRTIREQTGCNDPYKSVKDFSNQVAKDALPELEEMIAASKSPFETATRIAIAGNIIDYGIPNHDDILDIHPQIDFALNAQLADGAIEQFQAAIDQAKDILYLGDNTGEIFFDKLLLKQLPAEKVTYVVRGHPVINDVTYDDAKLAGITDIVPVIDNGADAPGTILDTCTKQFKERYDRADLIIAKGQGNFETLVGSDKDIFFLFKVKCHVVAAMTDKPYGQIMLVRNKDI